MTPQRPSPPLALENLATMLRLLDQLMDWSEYLPDEQRTSIDAHLSGIQQIVGREFAKRERARVAAWGMVSADNSITRTSNGCPFIAQGYLPINCPM